MRKGQIWWIVTVLAAAGMYLAGRPAVALCEEVGAGQAARQTAAQHPKGAAAALPVVRSWDFDQDRSYQPASGWTVLAGDWEVMHDPEAASLPNEFGLPQYGLPRLEANLVWLKSFFTATDQLAVVSDRAPYADFDWQALYRAAGGSFARSGGLALRLVDRGNYYLFAALAPGQQVVLYRVKDGEKRELARKPAAVSAGVWHELKVEARGDRLVCYFDGGKAFEARDGSIKAGRVGLWALNNARVFFDNAKLTLPGAVAGAAAPVGHAGS
jgi:hypothetical protein